MSDRADNLISKLVLFGFNPDEANVYLDLIKQNNSSALSISKNLGLSRTRVYRILDRLIHKGFVTEEIKEYGTKYRAESYEKLNLLIEESESRVADLKANAPLLFGKLAELQLGTNSESKILHYRGQEGLKQVTWNSTKLLGDFRIYEVNLLHDVVDYSFAEKARKEFAKNQSNKFYQLTNAREFEGFTDIKEHIKQCNIRHIPREDLEIKFEIQIYNDVCCMFEYTDKDIFIVEIYNKNLAEMQKQLFDLIWRYAKPMEILDGRGRARVVL